MYLRKSEEVDTKFGPRKPSLNKSFKARTSGRLNRTLKKSVNPLYGKKAMGLINNPKKYVYNKVYNKTSFDILKDYKDGFHQPNLAFDSIKEIPDLDIRWKDDDGNIINIKNEMIKFKGKDSDLIKLPTELLGNIEIIDNEFIVYEKSQDTPFLKIGIPKSAESKVNEFINKTTGDYDNRTKLDKFSDGVDVTVSVFQGLWALLQLVFYLGLLIIIGYFIIKALFN